MWFFGGTGAHHRAPAVEVELRVVACRGRVGPAEGEEMRGAPEHRLLHRRAPSEAEVVQPRIDQEKLVGVGVGMRGGGDKGMWCAEFEGRDVGKVGGMLQDSEGLTRSGLSVHGLTRSGFRLSG